MHLFKTLLLRCYRGFSYLFNYLFIELPNGLDFSLRDKNNTSIQGSHGYALTSRGALINIFSHLPFDISDKSLIDIGSGKGGVICYSKQLGFNNCLGIEYEKNLHEIAVKNIKNLSLGDSVVSVNIDARLFKDYDLYDVYFMFNPFSDEIYSEVIRAISDQLSKDKYLICYGNLNKGAVLKYGFKLTYQGICPYRNNQINIFSREVLP